MQKHRRWPALLLALSILMSCLTGAVGGLTVQAANAENGGVVKNSEYPNLALSKPATSKNDEGYGLVASKAVDGSCQGENANSRWSSAMTQGETWLQVDLESYATIHSFQVVWTEPHANPYKIQFSKDGTTWVDAYTDNDGVNVDQYTAQTKNVNGGQRFNPHTLTYTLDKPMKEMRFARMWSDKKDSGYPCISVYEFRVFGEEGSVPEGLVNKDPANLALGKTASACKAPIPHWGVDKLTDGVVNRNADKKKQSRWSSEQGAPGWVQVDLREPQTFQSLVLEWEQPVVEDYHIDVSDNGTAWRTAYTAKKNTQGYPLRDVVTLENPETARYVKVCVDKLKEGAYPSVSLYEVEVYAPNVSSIDKTTDKSASASNKNDASVVIDDKAETVWNGKKGESFTVDLGTALKFNRYQIEWSVAAPYHVETSNDGRTWSGVYTTKQTPSNSDSVTLAFSCTQRYVRVTLDGDGAVKEFSVYQDLNFVNAFDTVRDRLNGITLTKDDTKLELPADLPDTIVVTYLGTDYEQVIDANRNIIRPLVDTEVMVGFRLESKNTPDEYILHEVAVLVPGVHTPGESKNEKPKVIPELQQWFGKTGQFTVHADARILVDPALSEEYMTMANRFAADYKAIVGKTITVQRGVNPKAGDFYFVVSPVSMEKETYEMRIGEYVTIESSHHVGAFWSTRSILQILKQTGGTIPQGDVRDYPKYKVRGLSFDVGRRYVPMHFLESWASQMAWYKMNDLGLHLTDNTFDLSFGGFPLESNVPNLTNPEGMYYTKDQFRQFQLMAKEMGIMVVPEFDTPGHSLPFTEARPDLARPGKKEYLDVQNPGTIPFVQSVFNEYLDGKNPVFLEDAVINIGTDEYKGGSQAEKEAFRAYQDAMLKYILSKGHTPRAWGSQTENHGTTPVQAEGVQLYMWYKGYANAKEMYDLGYQMININDGDTYIVPGAGYYYDYLNKNHIYNNFDPSKLYNSFKVPAGDPQILGGSYALWNDCTGGNDNGAADVETLDRLFAALPVMAAKTWGDGKDNTLAELDAIVEKTGFAPNTNPTYKVESNGDTVVSYDFDKGSETLDGSLNHYDLISKGENVTFAPGHSGTALTLKGGSSYVETPLTDKGVGTTLDFWIKRDANSGNDEQILFESEIGQIKAVQKGTGKFGFSREARDYSFNYELPKDQWVHITIVTEFAKTTLYVNGQKIETLERVEYTGTDGKKHWRGKWASLVTPLTRIGSKTNAFVGQIDSLRVYDLTARSTEEIEALGHRVSKVETLPEIHVPDGTNLNELKLPAKVTLTLANGEQVEVSVTWTCDDYQGQAGTYTFTGALQIPEGVTNPMNLNATVQVVVDPVETADKTQLEQLVAKAEGMDLTGYTAESVESFKTALEAAQAVMANETLTKKDQAIVDTAVAQLEEAIKGLTKDTTPVDPEKPEPEPEKPAPDVKPEPEKPNPAPAPDVKPEPPKTGDNSSVMMWAAVAMASLAGIACTAVALMDSRKRRSI